MGEPDRGIAAFDGARWRQVLTGVESVRSLLHARDGSLWAAAGSALLRYVHNGPSSLLLSHSLARLC